MGRWDKLARLRECVFAHSCSEMRGVLSKMDAHSSPNSPKQIEIYTTVSQWERPAGRAQAASIQLITGSLWSK